MVSRVTRSQGLLALAHACRLLMFVAVTSLLGRLLPPADFAFVSLVSGLYIVAMEGLDMGTSAVATRQIAAQPAAERTILASLLALRRYLAGLMVVVLLVCACAVRAATAAQSGVLVLAAGGIFLLHLHGYQLVFQLRQSYGRMVTLGLAAQLVFLLASVAALKAHAGGAAMALLVVLREAVVALGSRCLALRQLGGRLRVSWADPGMRPLLQSGWMIGVAGVSYKLAVYGGVFWLYQPESPEVLARFSAAHRLLVPMVDLAWLVVNPLFVSMGLAVVHGTQAFRVQLEGHATLALGLSSVLAVAAYFAAPLVIHGLYGEAYSAGPDSAIGPFRWLALGGLFAWVTPVFVVAETTRGRARSLMWLGLSCLLLAVLGNAWALPGRGAEGAAQVLCLCEAFVFCVMLGRFAVRGEIRLNVAWLMYLAPALALGIVLARLAAYPEWQLLVAMAWVPASAWLLARLPAQRACRASMALVSGPWNPPSPSKTFAARKPSP